MRYRYTRAFTVEGALPGQSQEIVLLDEPSEGIKFVLTASPHAFLAGAYKSMARGMLTAANIRVVGFPPPPPLKPFGQVIEEIQGEREQRREGRMVLICQFDGRTDIQISTAAVDGETFSYVHLVEADKVTDRHQRQIQRAIASLFAADSLVVRFEDFAQGLRITTDAGVETLAVTLGVGLSSVRRTVIDLQKEAKLRAGFERCFRSGKDITRVVRLLSDSLLATGDRLRSFLAAWTSLEIFVNKFSSRPEEGKSETQKQPALIFRFNSAATNLSVDAPGKKEAKFKKIKKSREELVHGDEVDERLFPIEETQALVRAFLERID